MQGTVDKETSSHRRGTNQIQGVTVTLELEDYCVEKRRKNHFR